MPELHKNNWERRQRAALDWICKSIAATGGHGSAHSYALHSGWAKAYPETTGYLIETLLDHDHLSDETRNFHALAHGCANWLETLQQPTGAYPGLLVGHTQPSVFNTGQILFGLLRCGREASATRAAHWLLAVQDEDGGWRQAAYHPGFEPTYYTRVLWPLLCFEEQYPGRLPGLREGVLRGLQRYAARFLPNSALSDWGFRPGAAAFTHTIAYALEGFWMCGKLLGNADILQKTADSTRKIINLRRENGKTAGAYTTDWRGDYRFLCATGNAQLSILCHRIWVDTQEPLFAEAAADFLEEMLPAQYLGFFGPIHGAVAGSSPVWGAYTPLRYPNWAAKFFLDAVAMQRLGR